MLSPFHGRFRITGCYLQNWGHWAPPSKPHHGLDLVGDDDTTIYSPLAGVVEHAGDAGDGFGIYARIRASDGKKHYFCHMSRIIVKAGQKIGVGDRLGVMGMTGNVTGPHTHYEIRIPKIFGYSLASPAAYLGLPNKQGSYSYDPAAQAVKSGPPAIVHIDLPKASTVVSGDIIGRGWGLHAKGFKRFDLWLDVGTAAQKNLGTAGAPTDRPDVAKLFSGKGYAHPENAGIRFAIPAGDLPKGAHTLCIAGVPDDDGTAAWARIPIVIH